MRGRVNAMVRLLIAAIIVAVSVEVCPAAKKKRTIRSAQSEQQASRQRIKETTRKINDNAAKTESTINQLNLIRGEINMKEVQISRTQSVIDSLNSAISVSTDSIRAMNDRLDRMRAVYVKAMRRLQGTQYATDMLGYVFSSETFTKAYARLRYIQEFSRWRNRQSEQIRAVIESIKQQQAHLSGLHRQRTSALTALSSDQAILKIRHAQTDKMVTQLRRDGASLQRALEKEKQRLRKIDNEISRMVEAERREHERRKQQEKQRRSAAAGKNASKQKPAGKGGAVSPRAKSPIDNSDPDAAMTSKFAAARGKMIFPVQSPYRIVSKYGSSNGQPYNTGVEIVLDGSSSVRAVFEGVVSRIYKNETEGFYSIMVRHGAYITVYYHIAKPSVKARDKVKAGQMLGTAATDLRYSRPMLHFEVRKGGETFNPLSWVK